VLVLDAPANYPPLLSIFGGKITTYRRLAEAALDRLKDHLPAARRPAWTGAAPLPGGDFPQMGYEALVTETISHYPFPDPSMAARLVRAYGTRVTRVMTNANSIADLGRHFGADLYAAEVEYLMAEEWAETAEDVLWRRTKLGLRLSNDQKSDLASWMKSDMRRGERLWTQMAR
jgi:glycerol-3-phosphate dehydrogenase